MPRKCEAKSSTALPPASRSRRNGRTSKANRDVRVVTAAYDSPYRSASDSETTQADGASRPAKPHWRRARLEGGVLRSYVVRHGDLVTGSEAVECFEERFIAPLEQRCEALGGDHDVAQLGDRGIEGRRELGAQRREGVPTLPSVSRAGVSQQEHVGVHDGRVADGTDPVGAAIGCGPVEHDVHPVGRQEIPLLEEPRLDAGRTRLWHARVQEHRAHGRSPRSDATSQYPRPGRTRVPTALPSRDDHEPWNARRSGPRDRCDARAHPLQPAQPRGRRDRAHAVGGHAAGPHLGRRPVHGEGRRAAPGGGRGAGRPAHHLVHRGARDERHAARHRARRHRGRAVLRVRHDRARLRPPGRPGALLRHRGRRRSASTRAPRGAHGPIGPRRGADPLRRRRLRRRRHQRPSSRDWPRAELVEDNAHGLFGRRDGRPLGSFGRFASLELPRDEELHLRRGRRADRQPARGRRAGQRRSTTRARTGRRSCSARSTSTRGRTSARRSD